MRKFIALTQTEEEVAKQIVDCAYIIHKRLGPGLLENVYEICFCHELKKRRLSFERQVSVPVVYDNLKFQTGFRLDVIVEDLIICELKSVLEMNPVFESQILSYLRLTGKRLGFLINFKVLVISKGIKRIIL